MFKITIEAATMSELATSALALAAQFQGETPKPSTRSGRRAVGSVEPSSVDSPQADLRSDAPAADDVDAELLAEVPKAPAGANAVVDAGTGQPVAQTQKMTVEDVKAAAAKLAGKDTPKLAELINKHGGTKLSEIPPANLGAFAGDVMAALAA